MRGYRYGILALLVPTVLLLGQMGFFDAELWNQGAANAVRLAREMVPPDLGVLPVAMQALGETLAIAFVGTVMGFTVALPLAFLGSPLVAPRSVVLGARLLAGMLRTVPYVLWAVVMVVVVGLGPRAGTLGVALYTIGFLAKLFTEAFDAVDPEILEAVRGAGVRRWHLARFILWPESANCILSQLLFILEYNVRASAILGFVGAGGIGFYFQTYLAMLQYSRVLTLLLVLLVFIMAMDVASALLRRRYLLQT